MRQVGFTAVFRVFSVLFALGAFALSFAQAVQTHQSWALFAKRVAQSAPPAIGSATAEAARAANVFVIQPAWSWTVRTATNLWTAPSRPAMPVRQAAKAPAAKPPVLRPSINPPPVAKAPTGAPPKMELVQPPAETDTLLPAPDAAPPPPAEVARVLAHLKLGLTKELYENFELFLYVSKADRGPWHQRMFAFAKEKTGDLKLLYSFPVSTGREVLTPNPGNTAMWNTNTPTGYFQLDPERVYKRYTSAQWGHKMPFAMFFSWEHEGRQTGVAIHSAVDGDIQLLGNRASAGCVRLHPQNAELLYRLIRNNYRGSAPLFAYDKRTATMSKEGLLMHDKAGKLQFAEGYKVLVLIENTGGDDIVAALF